MNTAFGWGGNLAKISVPDSRCNGRLRRGNCALMFEAGVTEHRFSLAGDEWHSGGYATNSALRLGLHAHLAFALSAAVHAVFTALGVMREALLKKELLFVCRECELVFADNAMQFAINKFAINKGGDDAYSHALNE